MTNLYTKEDVKEKARELAKMVAETEEIDFYKRAEKQVNDHIRIQELIAQIKKQQKEAVNLKHYGKTEALKQVEEKIDSLHNEIDEIPLVQEFKRSQIEVNYLLQMITNTISKTVTDEIIISTDGDLLKGRTVKSPF
ncbi:YlbF/YmcA family competence regulator [Alkalicoccobacillus gibsonii]|jgi:cell fate (sporulation/competence/biofilm development) regulator YmcA (YheA/YmcA/DUF963 family)|uniref:RicAFT regulatory complex protein RicA family protein n=1 Tax=Alkalicoccobacillus gibsonii TaxID=79881 RepID=A0ABU9VJE5_9BACI|nr:RicAFT regulatory complex protein RicA family protein [Alkalicoccobacillus gibsonii]MBM0065079.1 RicAFT regulatory complex protein RicA family protein [Alkalicoccobacillus gibsonii]